jgi:hypothetical protein
MTQTYYRLWVRHLTSTGGRGEWLFTAGSFFAPGPEEVAGQVHVLDA